MSGNFEVCAIGTLQRLAQVEAERDALLEVVRKVSMNAVYVEKGECSLSIGIVREVDAVLAKLGGNDE